MRKIIPKEMYIHIYYFILTYFISPFYAVKFLKGKHICFYCFIILR